MRIAILQAADDPTGLGGSYERAFLGLGHTVKRFWALSAHRWRESTVDRIVSRLRRAWRTKDAWRRTFAEAVAFRPDIVIAMRCDRAPLDLLRDFRRQVGVPLWNFYADTPYVHPGVDYLAEHPLFEEFDVMFTHSSPLLPSFFALGARHALWLPFAADPDLHEVRQRDPDPRFPVCYVGTWGPLMARRLEQVRPYGLAIYGPQWFRLKADDPLRRCWRPGEGLGPEIATAVARHEVQFNFARAEMGTTHSMKPFELAACGAACLMNRVADNEIFFRDGREMLLFDSADQMVAGLRRMLGDPELRLAMRAAAAERAREQTYRHRAITLLEFHRHGCWPAHGEWARGE